MTALAEAKWKGSLDESYDLVKAIDHNCGCKKEPDGALKELCAAHKAVAGDQRFLDGLLISRQRRERLIAGEYSTEDPPEPPC